jgi:hypothetical protein
MSGKLFIVAAITGVLVGLAAYIVIMCMLPIYPAQIPLVKALALLVGFLTFLIIVNDSRFSQW